MQRDTSLWPPSPKSTRSPTTTTDRNSSITASSLIRRTHRRVSSPILTAETTTTTARRASVENESNNSKNNSNATTDENDLSCQDDYDNAKTFQGQRYTKRRKRKATWIQTTALTDPKMRFLASGCFLLICTSIYLWRNPTTMTTTTTIATTTSSLERVLHHPNHVQDPAYDTEQNRWSYSLKPVLLPTSRISVHDNDDEEEWSDFGGLELENLGHAREIWYDENDVHYMQEQMRQQYHAQFYNSHYHHHYHHPQHHHHHYHGHYPDAEPRPLRTFRASSGSEETCRPVAWQDDVHSTCNVFHEFDFGMSFDQGHSKYLGGGFFRRVFLAEKSRESLVVKLAAMSRFVDLEKDAWDSCRQEAVVNDALSPHPRIVDMFGFCGLSMLSETMAKGNLYSVAAPHWERCENEYTLPDNPWPLRNDLTGLQKVQFALEMAEALSVLHNYPSGRIVHNDMQLGQFLRADDGSPLKLTDFNMATILEWEDHPNGQPCKFTFSETPGNAPEEYKQNFLDEKIDIFNLASNFYALLTGVEPFYDLCEDEDISRLILNKTLPSIDERWLQRSSAERDLANLIPKMWAFDPHERPSASQVIEQLREIISSTNKSTMLR